MDVKKEEFTLLDHLSSDSSVDDLQFRPAPSTRKKKKFFKTRKQNVAMNNNDVKEPGCSCWLFFQLVLFIILLLGLAGLSWTTWSLHKKIALLSMQNDESSAKKDAEEMTSVKNKLSELEDLISAIQSGPSGLESIGANITSLSAQVQSLNQSVGALKQSVSAAADLVKLPQTVNSIAESMANIGSESEATKQTVKDLSSSKKDYEDFKVQTSKTIENLQKNIVRLNQSLSTSSQSSSSSSSSSATSDTEQLADMVTELSGFIHKQVGRIDGEISGINASLQATIIKNQEGMLSHQVALNRVLNDTLYLYSRLDGNSNLGGEFDVKHELQLMATELLQNLTESLSTGGSSELSTDQLEEMKLRVNRLEKSFEEYKTSHADDLNNNLINLNTTKAMEDEISRVFYAFRDKYGLDVKDIKDQVQYLVRLTASHNASLVKLQHEVQEILHILDAIIGNDTDVTESDVDAEDLSHGTDHKNRDVDGRAEKGMVDGVKTSLRSSFGGLLSDLQGVDSRKRPKKAR